MSFRKNCGRLALALCLSVGFMGGGDADAADRASVSSTRVDLVRRIHEPDYGKEKAGDVKQAMEKKAVEKKVEKKDAEGMMMRRWEVESRDTGGTLLFSDSPEYVSRDGILYADTVSGDARILYYHLNDTDQRKKVAVVLQNPQDVPATVTVTRGGDSAPSEDYLKVGKATQTAYFRSRMHDVIHLKPGEKRLLRTAMDQRVLRPGQLVYGVYDFSAANKVKVSVIMYPENVSPYVFIEGAKVLPKDEQRLRGTFHGMDRVITSVKPYDGAKEGAVYIPLVDDVWDTYREGVDATDGSKVVNCGNYGVSYRLQIPTAGNGRTKYALSPLGGVYAGAMVARVSQGNPHVFLTPSGRTYFGDRAVSDKEYAAMENAREQGFELLTETTEQADLGDYANFVPVTFEFSPPGASNLPVNFILMPANP